MKKLLIIFLLVLFCGNASAGMLIGSGVVGGGDSYADIIYHWDAENNFVAEKGGITATNNSMIFDAVTFATGSYSVKRDGNNDNCVFSITSANFEKEGGQFAFWMYNEIGYQAGSENEIFDISADADNNMNLRIHSSGGLRFYWEGNTSVSVAEYTSSAMATATWYYIVLEWEPGATGNDLILTIFNVAGGTFGTASVASITAMNADPTTLRFGNDTADAHRVNIDHAVITNDVDRDMWLIRNTVGF